MTVAVLGLVGLRRLPLRRPAGRRGAGPAGRALLRGAPDRDPGARHPGLDLHTVVHGLVMALFGMLGFVLHSLALQRVSVTAATAPMVLVETFVPP